MKDKMDHPENDELVADQKGSANQKPVGVDSSRRRLFGAGVAAPIILSMSSRTAWGGALCAPSAFNSATFSSHHPAEANMCSQLAGKSPAAWLRDTGNWPSRSGSQILLSDQSLFSSDPARTYQVVLEENDTLEAHAIAAFFNAKKDLITLGEPSRSAAVNKVKAMFNAFLIGGGYSTSSGEVFWDSASNGSGFTMKQYFTQYQTL